jgi:hypothetical protein
MEISFHLPNTASPSSFCQQLSITSDISSSDIPEGAFLLGPLGGGAEEKGSNSSSDKTLFLLFRLIAGFRSWPSQLSGEDGGLGGMVEIATQCLRAILLNMAARILPITVNVHSQNPA